MATTNKYEKSPQKIFSKKSNWVSFFTLIFAFIGLSISFFNIQFSYQVISVMFLLIAVENFVNQFGYMEDIRAKLDSIKPQSSSFIEMKIRRNSKSIAATIQEAKHELFISGINLHTLSGFDKDILMRANEGIKIRFLVLDVYNEELLKAHERMVCREIKGPRSTFFFLKHFIGNANIEIRQTNFIMPVMFMAYDINKTYGYIKAEHFLNNRDNTELPNIELTSDKDWYDKYKVNIEEIWKKSKPYNPKEK